MCRRHEISEATFYQWKAKFGGLYMSEAKRLRARSSGAEAGASEPWKRGLSLAALPQGPNRRWSLDFLSDVFTDGRRFRILAVVDGFSRECLTLVADTSLSSARTARELDAIMAWRGKPAMVVSDNGTELTSTAILRWSQEHEVELLGTGWKRTKHPMPLSCKMPEPGLISGDFSD